MDFTTIGTVGSYLKQKNLNFAANYKIKTGQRVADANGNLHFAKSTMFDQMVAAQKKSDSEVDAAKISSIKQKLMNGKKLSTEELGYLREKDPKLYKKAKHAEEAREELQSELKKAKTKQEARQAVTQAMVKASAEASAELAAYKSALNAGGGEVSTAGYQAGTEVGGNVAAVEGSTENLSAEESPSLIQVNEKISADGEEMTGAAVEVTKAEIQANQDAAENIEQANKEFSDAQKTEEPSKENPSANKLSSKFALNNSATDINSPQDIMEKFIMTIRALEDEWAQFTKSKDYEEMPEDYFSEDDREKVSKKSSKKPYKDITAPSQKLSDIISVYRKAMLYQPSTGK